MVGGGQGGKGEQGGVGRGRILDGDGIWSVMKLAVK